MKKGQIMSKEQKKLISIANISEHNGMFGKTPWNKGTMGIQVSGMKGKKMTEESRNKMRLAKLGKPRAGNPAHWKMSEVMKLKMSQARKGLWSGKSNPRWKGGITPLQAKIRNSAEYIEWRKHVFNRDDYVCQGCGTRGGKLHADHELPFSLYPDLRLEVLNGRTLCIPCHKKTPTWCGRVNANAGKL